MNRQLIVRIILVLVCITGLAAVFIFQDFGLLGSLSKSFSPVGRFILKRTFRFILNDILTIGLIYALFQEKKYVIFSLWVQAVGVILFLIPYFALKLYYPAYNGPLISYLHRLILNPTLLLLLIPAFYYQRNLQKQ